MTVIVTDHALVCTDCAIVLANGTDGNEELEAHARGMEIEAGDIWIVESGVIAFSRARCQTCGDTLAGERLDASVLSEI